MGGMTPLYLAATFGQLETVKLLHAACPAAAAMKDGFGNTPLHTAAGGGHLEAVKLLHAAYPEAAAMKANKGSTPAEVAKACENGDWEAVVAFLGSPQ